LRDSDVRSQLQRMTLPPEALLLRHMEGLLFQTSSMLRASARWGSLLEDLVEGAAPVGKLGAEHAAWLARRAEGAVPAPSLTRTP
jgi:hypothetical protein